MNEELTSGLLWNKAGQAGFLLAAVTIAFTLLGGLAGKMTGVGGSMLAFFATAAKITACILLIHLFLSRLKKSHPKADYGTLRKYGMRTVLCSSLLVAAYTLFSVISAGDQVASEAVAAATEMMESYGMGVDSNTAAQFEKVGDNLPVITFVTMFLYCLLWGWLLVPMTAHRIAPPDPFADLGNKDGDDNQL